MTTFTKGQEVFGIDGQLAIYVVEFDGEHFVAPVVDTDQESVIQKPRAWKHVFAAPPIEKHNADVAALSEQVATLRSELKALAEEKRIAEQQRTATLANLSKISALQRIQDYLDGKFQFFVHNTESGPPEIATLKELIECKEFRGDTRLLSLFGDSKGDLLWKVNRYRDGSGSWCNVTPWETREQCVADIQARFTNLVSAWRRDPGKDTWTFTRWLDAMPALGIPVPEDVLVWRRATERKGLTDALSKAAKTLDDARTALDAFDAKGGAA